MTNQSRRKFMFHSLLCLAAMPLGVGVLSPRAFAAQLPRLDPENPQAKALNYVEDAADASDHDAYEQGRKCENCALFKPDDSGCELFPENSVQPGGWCQSWVQSS
jgi:hypothetical protein